MSEWASYKTAQSNMNPNVQDEVISKTNKVSHKLKEMYKNNILPAEKRYRYDFFYESPHLTDVEFDNVLESPIKPLVSSKLKEVTKFFIENSVVSEFFSNV